MAAAEHEQEAAVDVLIDQAERKAAALERAPAGAVCEQHSDMAAGVALSLRLLIGLYRRSARPTLMSPGGLASLGIPTPVCVLIWVVGSSKGWW
jgi:hypothetical protein